MKNQVPFTYEAKMDRLTESATALWMINDSSLVTEAPVEASDITSTMNMIFNALAGQLHMIALEDGKEQLARCIREWVKFLIDFQDELRSQ